jgi:phospholipase C
VLPLSIQKALTINPERGSTYLDAEHIVFLMQENRSFDHAYGTLQEVRGFNDPRAIKLPNTPEKAEQIYNLLSSDGEIFMKMEKTFFANRFAMLRDKFGTSWMLLNEN